MAFLTDNELKVALLAAMGVEALESRWDTIVSLANESAQNEITEKLTARGYSTAQIEAWSRQQEFNYWMGIYNAQVLGNNTESYGDVWLEKLKRYFAELEEVILDDTTSAGGYASGECDTSNDVFTLPDNTDIDAWEQSDL